MSRGKNQVSEDPWRNERKHLTCENGEVDSEWGFRGWRHFYSIKRNWVVLQACMKMAFHYPDRDGEGGRKGGRKRERKERERK